jgi:hypothetical protein
VSVDGADGRGIRDEYGLFLATCRLRQVDTLKILSSEPL